ncbi:uncharacterized protein LOC144866425 [Branchiostoma floridae x Branchiostoma japonicum]
METGSSNEKMVIRACKQLQEKLNGKSTCYKRNLLRDENFMQWKLYETMTHFSPETNIMVNYEHSLLNTDCTVDLAIGATDDQTFPPTVIEIKNGKRGAQPKSVRSNLARLSFLLHNNGCNEGFFIWMGTRLALDLFDAGNSCGLDYEQKLVVRPRDVSRISRRGNYPIPATFSRKIIYSSCEGGGKYNLCVRVYKVTVPVGEANYKNRNFSKGQLAPFLQSAYAGNTTTSLGCDLPVKMDPLIATYYRRASIPDNLVRKKRGSNPDLPPIEQATEQATRSWLAGKRMSII